METNTLPPMDMTPGPTGCCPRFDPTGRDGRHLRFDDAPLVRARGDGGAPTRVLPFSATCPNCALAYGETFVVGLIEVAPIATEETVE